MKEEKDQDVLKELGSVLIELKEVLNLKMLKEEDNIKKVTNNTDSLIELVKLMNDFNGRKK
jgi:hypothetical protein